MIEIDLGIDRYYTEKNVFQSQHALNVLHLCLFSLFNVMVVFLKFWTVKQEAEILQITFATIWEKLTVWNNKHFNQIFF